MEHIQSFIFTHSMTILTSLSIMVIVYILLLGVQKILVSKGRKRANMTNNLWDDMLVDLIQNIRKYFIFFASVYIGILWIHLPERGRLIVDKAFIIIALIQAAQLAGIVINFWLTNKLKAKGDNDLEMASTIGLISFGVKALVYTLILLMALNNLGIDITALIAGLGVGGVAVALALQNILADLFSSLTIVMDKPFIVGDFIVVNDMMGTVEHIGLKTTRLRSISGEQLIFGNGDLLKSRIKNFKRMYQRRVVQSLTVTYQTSAENLDAIPAYVKQIIEKHEDITFERCHFLKFLESSLEFELVYWVKKADFNLYADRAHAINIEIFKKFASEKIEFAYPTRTLFLQTPEGMSLKLTGNEIKA